MKIIYLTWGETPRFAGVYNSQILQLIKRLQSKVDIYLISGLPLINSGLFREKFGYFKSLRMIKSFLTYNGENRFFLIPIFAVQTVIYPKFLFGYMISFLSDKILLKKIKKLNPDIIHCRGYHSTSLVIKLKKKYNLNYKIIFDPRGYAPGEAVISNRCKVNSYTYKQLKKIEQHNIDFSDTILTVSETMRTFFKGQGAKSVENVFLSSSLNIPKIANHRLKDDQIIFGYAGALDDKSWHKPKQLIELYTRLIVLFPNSKLKIITNSSHKKILSYIPDFLMNKIDLISCKNPNEVLIELSVCNVGLMSYFIPKSRVELDVAKSVFAIKTVEYFAVKLPIIVNKYCGGATDFILSKSLGWAYDPENLENFSVSLSEINKMKDSVDHEIFEDLFSYESNLNRYIKIYSSLKCS